MMDDAPIYGAGSTDVGKYREDNQDAIRLHIPVHDDQLHGHGHLFGIADGLGGYSHGSLASTTALDTFFGSFYSAAPGKSPQNLRSAVQQANTAVLQTSHQLGSVRMGTTLSAANIVGSQLHIAHVGDSRVYLVRGRQVMCLTNDHTHVGEMVRMKLLSPDKVRHHAHRSVLDRCIGTQLFVQPEITQFPLQVDDYLILCTDGVWAVIEDEEFGQIVRTEGDPSLITQHLIGQAMDRDSDDNVSAITIHVRQFAAREAKVGAPEKGSVLTKLFRKRLFTTVAG
jgi:protein phosphatase